jgi:hypothetical protein
MIRQRLITTITSFATAADVTLAELRLEAILPADEGTAEVLRHRWGDDRRCPRDRGEHIGSIGAGCSANQLPTARIAGNHERPIVPR